MMKQAVLVGAVAFALLAAACPATCCTGDSPESVIECYTAAYAQRDIAGIEELYAEDYIWVDVTPLRAQVWDRSTAVESVTKMFGHPDEPSISLTLDGPFDVVSDDSGGTWRIEGIEMNLVIVFPGAAAPDTAQGCATLYVREVKDTPGAFEIFREVTFGEGDCARWR